MKPYTYRGFHLSIVKPAKPIFHQKVVLLIGSITIFYSNHHKVFRTFLNSQCLKMTEKVSFNISTMSAKRATFTFWMDKSSSNMPNMVNFGEFLKSQSLRSNIVTRHVTFYRKKNWFKCLNSKIQMQHWEIFKHCEIA